MCRKAIQALEDEIFRLFVVPKERLPLVPSVPPRSSALPSGPKLEGTLESLVHPPTAKKPKL